ncbi:FAD:protein FMN transferase [bacterium]|nr:FAD:protein FMN transferase [bacterium]
MKQFNIIKWGSVYCPFLILGLFACNQPKQTWNKLEGEAIGTTYHITYYGNADEGVTKAQLDSLFDWINHALSTYQENSMISAFNANSDKIWKIKSNMKYAYSDVQHMINMLDMSAYLSKQTGGAFDPTAGALFEAWEVQGKKGVMPDSNLIDSILVRVGMDKLKAMPNGLPQYVDSLLQLNFNAIAKGYTVDIIGDMLHASGVDRFMVEVGGEVLCMGQNPDNKAWTIGVNKPEIGSDAQSIFEVIELEDKALATSGNYRHFYQIGDSILGHTLDPRSGYPVNNELRSATAIHEACSFADAYATAFMVLGLDSSKKIVEQDTTLSAYFIYEEAGGLKGVFVE